MTTTLNFTSLSTSQRAEHWHSVRLGQLLRVLFQGRYQDLMDALSKSVPKRGLSGGVHAVLLGILGKSWRASFKQGFCTKAGACSSLYCLTQERKESSGNRGRARGMELVGDIWSLHMQRKRAGAQTSRDCCSGGTMLGSMRWQTPPQCGQVWHSVDNQLLFMFQVWPEGSKHTIASIALARGLWDLCFTLSCKVMHTS